MSRPIPKQHYQIAILSSGRKVVACRKDSMEKITTDARAITCKECLRRMNEEAKAIANRCIESNHLGR